MFFVRDVIQHGRKGKFRIVGIHQDAVFLFDLNAVRTVIAEHSLEALKSGLGKGKVQFLAGHAFNCRAGHDLSPAQVLRIAQRLEQVRDLVARMPAIFYSPDRGRLVSQASRNFGVSAKTLHKVLFQFWHGGMTMDALVPHFERCGAPGQDKPLGTVRGRKPDEGTARAPALTQEMLDAFQRCTDGHYKRNRHITLAENYELARDLLCTRSVTDPETGAPITFVNDPDVAIPTLRQFLYWYYKQGRAKSDAKARFGDVRIALRSRARLSYAAQDNPNAGGRFIVDSTKLDVNLVSSTNREIFIGTPTFYIVVDEVTAMIVGFAISLENASWLAQGVAIFNCFEDKVAFCRRYGIEIALEDWPVHGMMPIRFLFDRGEARGELATEFVRKSGLIVENTSPYRGDLKGICEQRFDLVNETLRPQIPGARDADSGKRGERDPRLNASLNLEEITQVLIHTIIYLNNRVVKGFRQSKAMLAQQVPNIPAAMWNWCLDTGRSALIRFDKDELGISLLPSGTGSITPQGVCFKGLFYTCERAESEKWFEQVTAAGSQRQIGLSYHPWLMDAVYLHVEAGRRPELAVLTPYNQNFAGLSLPEVEQLRAAKRIATQGRQLNQTLLHADYRNQVSHIVQSAVQERIGDLRPRDLKGAREHRALDAASNREDEKERLRLGIAHYDAQSGDPEGGRELQGPPPGDELGDGEAL